MTAAVSRPLVLGVETSCDETSVAVLDGDHRIPQVGLGIHCDGQPAPAGTAPPRLGADTTGVLGNLLEMTDAEIDRLRDAGAI